MNNKNVTVAVLMAVYKNDNPDYFKEAIESIFNQDVKPYVKINVYLGIDGPIPDQLERAINKYENKIHKIVRSGKNIFLSGILNKIIENSDDESIFFRMDSDDVSYLNRFQTQIDFMENNPEVDILGAGLLEFNHSIENVVNERNYPQLMKQILKSIYLATPLGHPTVCFRRDTLIKLGGYSAGVFQNEDIELWLRALKEGYTISSLQEPLLYFRITPQTLNRRSYSKSKEELKIYLKGLYRLSGLNWKLIFPCLRFLFRLMPKWFISILYKSNARTYLVPDKK